MKTTNSVLTTYMPARFNETIEEKSKVVSLALSALSRLVGTLNSARPCCPRFSFYCASCAAIGVILIAVFVIYRLVQINEQSKKNRRETNTKIKEINKELEGLIDESIIRQEWMSIMIEASEKRFNQQLEEKARLKKELEKLEKSYCS